MDTRIQPLAEFITEKGAKETECLASIVYLVAMSEEEPFAEKVYSEHIPVDDRTNLLRKIVEHPDVVIADKYMDIHSIIG